MKLSGKLNEWRSTLALEQPVRKLGLSEPTDKAPVRARIRLLIRLLQRHHGRLLITEERLQSIHKTHIKEEQQLRPRRRERKVPPMNPATDWGYYRLFFWSDSNGRRILSEEGRETKDPNGEDANKRDVTAEHMDVIRWALIEMGVCDQDTPEISAAASWEAFLDDVIQKLSRWEVEGVVDSPSGTGRAVPTTKHAHISPPRSTEQMGFADNANAIEGSSSDLWLLARNLVTQGATDAALMLYLRAIPQLEKAFGPSDPVILLASHELGSLLSEIFPREPALPLLRMAESIVDPRKGGETDQVLTRLALERAEQLHCDEIEKILRRAIAAAEAASGRESQSLVVALCDLGRLLVSTGRAAEAEPLFERAVSIERLRSPSNVINVMRDLAFCLTTMDSGKSELVLRQITGIQEERYDEGSELAESFGALAELLYGWGRIDEAERYFRVADAKRWSLDAPWPYPNPVHLLEFSHILLTSDRAKAAEPLWREAFAQNRRKRGKSAIAVDLVATGFILISLQHRESAVSVIREALNLFWSEYPDANSIAAAYARYSEVLRRLGRLDDGDYLLERGQTILQS